MNNLDTFQKIPVRKKPNIKNKKNIMLKLNRKLQRKLKLQQQEMFFLIFLSLLLSTQEMLECARL